MSIHTISGPCADDDGANLWTIRDPWGGERLQRASLTPADSYVVHPSTTIPVHICHQGDVLGEVVHLEHGVDGGRTLQAVAAVDLPDDFPIDQPWYWSSTTISRVDGGRAVLEELSLVERSASVGLTPVTFLDGDIRTWAGRRRWPSPSQLPAAVSRAVHTCDARAADPRQALRIHRPTVDPTERVPAGYDGPAITRGGGRILRVS